jgi:hypothetical protein
MAALARVKYLRTQALQASKHRAGVPIDHSVAILACITPSSKPHRCDSSTLLVSRVAIAMSADCDLLDLDALDFDSPGNGHPASKEEPQDDADESMTDSTAAVGVVAVKREEVAMEDEEDDEDIAEDEHLAESAGGSAEDFDTPTKGKACIISLATACGEPWLSARGGFPSTYSWQA